VSDQLGLASAIIPPPTCLHPGDPYALRPTELEGTAFSQQPSRRQARDGGPHGSRPYVIQEQYATLKLVLMV
jgi:hypothetical protein